MFGVKVDVGACLRLRRVRVRAMPVATGTRKAALVRSTPDLRTRSSSIEFVSLLIRLLPAALGCT